MKTIGGRYQVLKKLGEGFGGAVYLVESAGQVVALKQLLIRHSQDGFNAKEILENFKQEFSILKTLNHPHILRILDFGYDATEKIYFFTTEFIEGKTIFDATRDLPSQDMEELFVQILRSLSYLHSQRIYHLDIKPSNIMVSPGTDGKLTAKLIDFGLSALKKKGIIAGSPGYIAPEATLQVPMDGRADLYSLGVTWYTCLEGRNPFEGKDLRETLALQKIWTPPPLSHHTNDIPAYLDPVLEKLLKKNPSERYHHADQVIRDLNWGGGKNYPLETGATALAYLPGEGKLVGRESEWKQLQNVFERVFITKSELKSSIAVTGPPGTGKSRLLKEFKYHAQLHTIPVLEDLESLNSPDDCDRLILIDDADENAFRRVESWLQSFHRHRVLLVVAGRQSYSRLGMWHQVVLQNLDRPDVAHYFASVLGIPHAPDILTEEFYRRSEGNPLFLTELMRSLIQSHQLFDDHGRWSTMRINEIGIDFAKLEVPRTLSDFCSQKFERLPEKARGMLIALSLAKAPLDRFDFSKMGLDSDPHAWNALQAENLIAIDQNGEVLLLNPNFRKWVESSRPAEELSKHHQLLGELLKNDPLRNEFTHYHLGNGTGPAAARFQALIQHGDQLAEKNLWAEAARAYESLLKIAAESDQLVEARLRLVKALFRSSDHAGARSVLEATNAILKKERENPKQRRWVQRTYKELGSIFIKEARLDLAHEALEASRVLLEQCEEDPQESMVLENLKASLLMREGKLSEAATICEKNYSSWKTWPLDQRKPVHNNELAGVYLAQGKAEEAKAALSEMRSLFQESGQAQKEANTLYALALCEFTLRHYPEAERLYRECAELCRKIKEEELLFHVFNELGNVAYALSDWEHASEHYHHALELAQHCAATDSSIGIAINLALVLLRKKDCPGASLYLRHVVETLETRPSLSLHQLQFLLQGYLALGKLHMDEKQWVESRDAHRDALHVIRSHTALERFRAPALIGMIKSEIHLRRMHQAQAYFAELKKEIRTPQEEAEMLEITESLKKLIAEKAF